MSTQTFTISPIPDDIFAKMQGKSFKDNCTVPRDDLRYIKVLHVGFDGETHVGELVVNRVTCLIYLSSFMKRVMRLKKSA